MQQKYVPSKQHLSSAYNLHPRDCRGFPVVFSQGPNLAVAVLANNITYTFIGCNSASLKFGRL